MEGERHKADTENTGDLVYLRSSSFLCLEKKAQKERKEDDRREWEGRRD